MNKLPFRTTLLKYHTYQNILEKSYVCKILVLEDVKILRFYVFKHENLNYQVNRIVNENG